MTTPPRDTKGRFTRKPQPDDYDEECEALGKSIRNAKMPWSQLEECGYAIALLTAGILGGVWLAPYVSSTATQSPDVSQTIENVSISSPEMFANPAISLARPETPPQVFVITFHPLPGRVTGWRDGKPILWK